MIETSGRTGIDALLDKLDNQSELDDKDIKIMNPVFGSYLFLNYGR